MGFSRTQLTTGLPPALAGHLWTITPAITHRVRPGPGLEGLPWQTVVQDPRLGPVRLTGCFHPGIGRALLVVVHGLGGEIDRPYVVAAARAAAAAGLPCLRLNLRGAGRDGEDLYHAGLTADLEAALASPELEPFDRVYLLGYSLGGHLSLRYSLEAPDPRVKAVAAVCAPLDLEACVRDIDQPRRWLYRRYILSGLKEIYARVAARRPLPLPVAEARRIRSVREWDRHTVAPRFGFHSAEHYYASTSVAPLLPKLRIPALMVYARHDPMVPPYVVEPALRACAPAAELLWIDRGGHVAFPSGLDLGIEGPRGLEAQVIRWLGEHG